MNARAWLVVGLIAALLFSALGMVGVAPATPGPRAAAANPEASHAAVPAASTSSMIAQASTSLDRGQGPSQGHPAQCAVESSTAARCGGFAPTRSGSAGISALPNTPAVAKDPGVAAHPSVAVAQAISWYNQTDIIGSASFPTPLPSVEQGGAMAFDPQLNEVVLWVGCGFTGCPTAETWTYNGIDWQNVTGSLLTAPSAREFSSMDYDPALGAIVMVGGFNSTDAAQNDTWTFSAVGWTNITATTGGTPQTVGNGGLAWDPAIGGLVYVDGCSVSSCTGSWSITSVLNGTWSETIIGGGWGPGLPFTTYMGAGSMVWDPSDQDLVWFGGYDFYAGTVNYTYTFTPTAGWTNISLTDGGCFIFTCSLEPAGRFYAAMTWDAQEGVILLTGGGNTSCGCTYNDTWEYLHGAWYPQDIVGGVPPAAFSPVLSPTLAVNSTGIPAFIVGGSCAGSGCSTNEWAWEVPPAPYIAASTFNPVDNGTNTTITATFTAPSGAGPIVYWEVVWGDASIGGPAVITGSTNTAYDVNFTHEYTAPGVYNVQVSADDFFYVQTTNVSYNITVNSSLAGSFTASHTTIDSGQGITFTGTAANGTPAYVYSWNFGDGTAAGSGASVAHTFSASGTHTVTMTLRDAGGGLVTKTMSVTVNPTLALTAAFAPTAPTTGEAVNFTGSATGGSGTFTYAWRFGDGGSSASQNPAHTYTTAGTYTATFWANDSLGSSASKTVSVTVTAPAPPATKSTSNGGLGSLTTILIIVVIIAVIAAVLGLALWRRKGSRGSTSPPPPAGGSMNAPPPPGAGGPPPGAV
jgi:PKD repeat protein